MQAIVETDGSILNVTATLYHNDVPYPDMEFTLREGKNVMTLPSQKLTEDRPHTFHLKLNISDEIQENNQAYGVVQIQDKPHILYAEGDVEHSDSLKKVLEENGFVVNVIPAMKIPTELVSLQQNEVLILSNVSADVLSSEQMDIIEVYVRDLGHGLVAIGGDKAFGAGGWTDTALERVLPVEMTPRERQVVRCALRLSLIHRVVWQTTSIHSRRLNLLLKGYARVFEIWKMKIRLQFSVLMSINETFPHSHQIMMR